MRPKKIIKASKEVTELKKVIQDIYWMARRYATGRKTYAPSMYNDAMVVALQNGVILKEDTTETPPTFWAKEEV